MRIESKNVLPDNLEFSGLTFLVLIKGSEVTNWSHHSIWFTFSIFKVKFPVFNVQKLSSAWNLFWKINKIFYCFPFKLVYFEAQNMNFRNLKLTLISWGKSESMIGVWLRRPTVRCFFSILQTTSRDFNFGRRNGTRTSN